MNQKQEKALFGNVLPKKPMDLTGYACLCKCLDMRAKSAFHNCWDMDQILSLARSQRDAIGALIECSIIMSENLDGWGYVHDEIRENILSAVIKDTWEEVKEAWEKKRGRKKHER